MILLDTNVVIDAHYGDAGARSRARELITNAVGGTGAAINPIILAELYSGPERGPSIEQDLIRSGITISDLPIAAAAICGRAYRKYRAARKRAGGGNAPATPLPDFFIGAHAQIMRWQLASRDTERYRTYFPDIEVVQP